MWIFKSAHNVVWLVSTKMLFKIQDIIDVVEDVVDVVEDVVDVVEDVVFQSGFALLAPPPGAHWR